MIDLNIYFLHFVLSYSLIQACTTSSSVRQKVEVIFYYCILCFFNTISATRQMPVGDEHGTLELYNPQPNIIQFCDRAAAAEAHYECHGPSPDVQICHQSAAQHGTIRAVNTSTVSANGDNTYRIAFHRRSDQLTQSDAGKIFCAVKTCDEQALAAAKDFARLTLCQTVPYALLNMATLTPKSGSTESGSGNHTATAAGFHGRGMTAATNDSHLLRQILRMATEKSSFSNRTERAQVMNFFSFPVQTVISWIYIGTILWCNVW